MGNSFGNIYRFTTFGESHGPAIGGVIDGVPAGVELCAGQVQARLDGRRPGAGTAGASARKEADRVEFLSGLMDGVTTGVPIGFVIRNTDARSCDYEQLKDVLRPGHADYVYNQKYGIRDHRGGGRASARETACRVVAGAVAEQVLAGLTGPVVAFVSRIGDVALPGCDYDYAFGADVAERVAASTVRCPHAATAEAMMRCVEEAERVGDTVGGTVTCVMHGVPAGWGEPLYGKLSAMLGAAMFSINAVKAVEIGDGTNASRARGSESVDALSVGDDGRVLSSWCHCGGIQGGISVGGAICLRVHFRPVATMMRRIATVDVKGRPAVWEPRGRHDVTCVPRAVEVVRAMAACVLLDACLMDRSSRI